MHDSLMGRCCCTHELPTEGGRRQVGKGSRVCIQGIETGAGFLPSPLLYGFIADDSAVRLGKIQ